MLGVCRNAVQALSSLSSNEGAHMNRLLATTCLLALATITACTSVTQGTGRAVGPVSASHSPDFPSNPPSETPSTTDSVAPSDTPTPTRAVPTRRQREDRLTAQTNGEAHVLVAVSGGFEAAAFDQRANIQFWRSVGNSVNWTQVGTSTYPYSPSIGGPADAKVSGALLSRMRHATFIVTGNFTGDSSGNAVAFTTGPKGWGVIKAEPNGNIGPSGQAVGADRIGLSYGFSFSGGKLVTEDCRTDQAIALCGSNPITKSWLWTGIDFRRV